MEICIVFKYDIDNIEYVDGVFLEKEQAEAYAELADKMNRWYGYEVVEYETDDYLEIFEKMKKEYENDEW